MILPATRMAFALRNRLSAASTRRSSRQATNSFGSIGLMPADRDQIRDVPRKFAL